MRPKGGPEFFPSDDMVDGQHGTIIIPPDAGGATQLLGGKEGLICFGAWYRCKDRWTKRGGELGLFQISKAIKTTLTYAMLVRLNSPTG